MGYSQAQKEKTHERIVAIASKRFREKGLAGFGIAELRHLAAPKGKLLHPAGSRYPSRS